MGESAHPDVVHESEGSHLSLGSHVCSRTDSDVSCACSSEEETGEDGERLGQGSQGLAHTSCTCVTGEDPLPSHRDWIWAAKYIPLSGTTSALDEGN